MRTRRPTLLTMPAVLEYLRAHRAGADVPAEYLARLGAGDRRRAESAQGLSQRLVAAMADIDVRTYGSFEREGLSSPGVVRKVAGILGVSRAQQVAMWRWVRRAVPVDLRAPADGVDSDLVDQLVGVAGAPAPAAWVTPEWDVLGANGSAVELLGPLARTGGNWAGAVLGPGGEAREVVVDWPACARQMLAALRMATVDPERTQRTAEVACEVRQHRPTAHLWDSCADMREGLDGMVLRVRPPSAASPRPVALRLTTLARGDARLVVFRPVPPTQADVGGTGACFSIQ